MPSGVFKCPEEFFEWQEVGFECQQEFFKMPRGGFFYVNWSFFYR